MNRPEYGKKSKKKAPRSCESCAYYDIISEDGDYGCVVDVDEDDAYREREDTRSCCPYYKFYDEYKSVQKQN